MGFKNEENHSLHSRAFVRVGDGAFERVPSAEWRRHWFYWGQRQFAEGTQLFGAALGLELLRWFFDDAVVWRR
jgi:hypothetical protein